MKKFALLFIPIFLFGCTTTTEKPVNETAEESAVEELEFVPQNVKAAQITTVDVEIKDKPFTISAVIKGKYENNCRTHYETKVTHMIKERVFNIEISTQDLQGKSLEETICTEESVPFEVTEALPVQAIDAGEFTVDVNGVTTKFSTEKNTIDDTRENLTKQAKEEYAKNQSDQ